MKFEKSEGQQNIEEKKTQAGGSGDEVAKEELLESKESVFHQELIDFLNRRKLELTDILKRKDINLTSLESPEYEDSDLVQALENKDEIGLSKELKKFDEGVIPSRSLREITNRQPSVILGLFNIGKMQQKISELGVSGEKIEAICPHWPEIENFYKWYQSYWEIISNISDATQLEVIFSAAEKQKNANVIEFLEEAWGDNIKPALERGEEGIVVDIARKNREILEVCGIQDFKDYYVDHLDEFKGLWRAGVMVALKLDDFVREVRKEVGSLWDHLYPNI